MTDADEQIKRLRSTRPDYAEEAAWHKFLLDAAHGTGGFKGKVGATATSLLGWAAEAYAQVNMLTRSLSPVTGRETYLDQFPREDKDKFEKRVDVAHYTNYVGPIHDLLLSYINKAEMNRDKLPDAVTDWMQDVDGKGTSWDTLQREVVRPRASLLGWCPVLFDLPATEIDQGAPMSRARAKELGIAPRCIPLYPVNILDWIEDSDGDLVAVKIRTDHHVRADLLGSKVTEERYALWYPDRVERFTVTRSGHDQDAITYSDIVSHSHGRVPLKVFRAKPTPDDKVRGMSTIGNSAVAARRHFNLESEMDDHIRGQVFAVLGVPVEDTGTPLGELVGGNGNAFSVPMASRLGLHYVAPPASVAETLEKRMDVMVREIYRTENVEHTKATGTTATSGVARAYEFEQTNRRLSGLRANLARAEHDALRLAGDMMQAASADELTVTSPTDFSIEDLATEIEAVLSALDLKLGATAETELRRRLISRMLPNLPQAVQDAIDAELEELRAQHEQDAALAREAAKAALLEGDDDSGKTSEDEPEQPVDEAA